MAAHWEFNALMALWLHVGGSFEAAGLAASVATAESSGNPNAESPQGDIGLWKINLRAHPQYEFVKLHDPVYNAKAAKQISGNGRSWTAWCTAYTDALCGTRGGWYDPTGNSPVGRIYREHPNAHPGKQPVWHTQPEGPPGLQGPMVPEPVTVFTAWHRLTWELSTGWPTQMKRVRRIRDALLRQAM